MIPRVVGCVLILFTGACAPCGREVRNSLASADNQLTAVTLDVDCGATTAVARWVVLQRSGDEKEQAVVVTINGTPDVLLTWKEQRTLQVTVPVDADIVLSLIHI